MEHKEHLAESIAGHEVRTFIHLGPLGIPVTIDHSAVSILKTENYGLFSTFFK